MQTSTVIDSKQPSVSVPAVAATFDIDPAHATAHFRVKHLMVANVRGELGQVTGQVVLDAADIERSQVTATIDVTGISTRNDGRDQHLRSADFLDVAAHPTITFRSRQVRQVKPGQLQVTGALTIRGVTQEVTLHAEVSDEIRDPWGNTKRGVEATAKINRKDFGVSWNATMDGGGIVVSDTIDINIELELTKRA